MNEKLSSCRLGGWLVVAMSGPLVYLAGRQSWLAIVTAAGVSLLCCWAVFSLGAHKLLDFRILCLLEYGFLATVCVGVSGWSAAVWPTGQGYPVVPLTLLALATAASWKGANQASKGVGVLFWLVTILYSVLLALGLRNIQPAYLMPQWETPGDLTWLVLLLPCTAQFLPREHGRPGGYISIAFAIALLITVWTEGNLSRGAAIQVSWPFYEAGESVRLFGVASRLESFISVGATVGFYGLYTLLLSAAGHLAEGVEMGFGKWGVLAAGFLSGAGVLLHWKIPYFVLVLGAFVLWVALPVLGSKILQRKCEKEQKNA